MRISARSCASAPCLPRRSKVASSRSLARVFGAPHTHRDAVVVAHGDGGRITAWRLAAQGAELDSNPPPTHPPPSAPRAPPPVPRLPCAATRFLSRVLCVLCDAVGWIDAGIGAARFLLGARRCSWRLWISTPRAAHAGVRRVGRRGRSVERWGRDEVMAG